MPPHFHGLPTPLHPPHPAVSLRSRSATASNLPSPTPVASPCHIEEPTPAALPVHPLRQSGVEGVRCRTLFIAPLAPTAPRGRARCFLARRAARARGSACKKKAGGVAPKTPFIARAISAATFRSGTWSPRPGRHLVSKRCSGEEPRCLRPARNASRRGRVAPIGRVACARMPSLGSSVSRCVATRHGLRGRRLHLNVHAGKPTANENCFSVTIVERSIGGTAP
jgi:hypothetical protein